jgi:hypothetical protein
MHCILCHNNPIFVSPKTQAKKWLINRTQLMA